LRVARDDSFSGIARPDDELGTPIPKNSLETGYGLTPPDTYELRLAMGFYQEHLAPEQHIELIYPNILLDECSLTIQMMAFATF
jgi:hypothetical protein